MARSRGTLLTIALVIGLVLVLIAVFRSCREGSVPPAERGRLDETSYLVLNLDRRGASGGPAAAEGVVTHEMQTHEMQLRAFV